MLIAIDGAQSSGKTTCWRLLQTLRLADVAFIPEVARIVAPYFGVHATHQWDSLLNDPPRLRSFFEFELQLLRQLQDGAVHAVIDSSALLVTAYARTFVSSELMPPRWAVYDWIFYCEPLQRVADDGFRFPRGRSAVDEAYRSLLKHHHDEALVSVLPADRERASLLVRHPIWNAFR